MKWNLVLMVALAALLPLAFVGGCLNYFIGRKPERKARQGKRAGDG